MLFKFLRIGVLAFSVVVALPVVALEDSPPLTSKEVKDVMQEIFQLHVSEQKMSPKLMQRAFKAYIDQFDPGKSYLLYSDVSEYLNASPLLLQTSVEEYSKADFSSFRHLDQIFLNAIQRRIAIEASSQQDVLSFFKASHKEHIGFFEERESFSTTESDLKVRVIEDTASFINYQESIVKDSDDVKRLKMIALFGSHLRDREAEFSGVDAQGRSLSISDLDNDFYVRVAKSLAHSLDTHTAFYSPEEAYDLRVRLEKGFYGLGLVFQETVDGIYVSKVLEGSPASQDGKIVVGDRVLSVQGKSLKGESFQEVLDQIRDVEGRDVVFRVSRHVDSQDVVQDVTVSRGQVVLNDDRVDVSYDQYSDGIIGKIKLHSFYEGDNGISSEQDVKNAIAYLKTKGHLKGLVLDLRDNSGGFLLQAVKVAGLFITNGVVVVSKYSDGFLRNFRDVDGRVYYGGPLVVLTSKASASAAEIVAQALQDYGAALVVGDKRTYGKGSIQHQTVIDGKSPFFYKVTVGRYYTVSGKSTQITGVIADINVPTIYSESRIGEEYADYPLKSEVIGSCYNDSLEDVDPAVRSWFKKFYLPTIQHKTEKWTSLLPQLRQKSQERISHSDRYQAFLKNLKKDPLYEGDEGSVDSSKNIDLQLDEAVNIVKDMVVLSYEASTKRSIEATAHQKTDSKENKG